jgi:hypothetical protein
VNGGGTPASDHHPASRLSPALLPALVFVLLHAVRPFVMGLYHDDWCLFRVKDLVPASEYATFFSTEFRDRPVLGLLLRAVNDAWSGEAWQLTLMASGFVALSAVALHALLLRITGLHERDRLAAAIATAAWIALPWGLGYSLWPIGTTTLLALASFLASSALAVDFMDRGGAGRLASAAALLAVSFLSYQSCYLGFIPVVLLAVALRPADRALRRRAAVAVGAGFCVQALALLHSLATTPKSTAPDASTALFLVGNVVYGLPRALAAPFGPLWVVPAAVVLAMGLVALRNGRRVDADRRRKARFALLACAAGIVMGTLPFSVARYLIQGVGIFSRTTVSASLWACVLLAIALMASRAWEPAARGRFLAWAGVLVALLLVASAWQMAGWAASWRRQNQILAEMPVDAIARLPSDAVVLLDEPMWIRGVEVFAATWDISAAVHSQPAMRAIPPSRRPRLAPIYTDVTMAWDGRELTLRPGSKLRASQLWAYSPRDGALRRIDAPGPILLQTAR